MGRIARTALPRSLRRFVLPTPTFRIANGSSLGNIPALRAVKVRGREYLRIIYGPEYTLPEHLERLKNRGLGTK